MGVDSDIVNATAPTKATEKECTTKRHREAHGRDTSVHKALKPLLETESSVYLRLVDVVNTSCKQQKLSVSRSSLSYVRRFVFYLFVSSLAIFFLISSETILMPRVNPPVLMI